MPVRVAAQGVGLLGTLISSKVNQWTLLVGTIPIVFALSATTSDGLPIDLQQRYELLITAAQSLFAVAILLDLSITLYGAFGLLSLFLVQFVVSITASPEVNRLTIIVLSIVYVVLALAQFARHWRRLAKLVRDGLVTPFSKLEREEGRLAAESERAGLQAGRPCTPMRLPSCSSTSSDARPGSCPSPRSTTATPRCTWRSPATCSTPPGGC